MEAQKQNKQGEQEVIIDLHNHLLAALPKERAHDASTSPFVKKLTSVNTRLTSGYAFNGKLVDRGTVVATPGIYLVATVNSSRACPRTHYSVVELDSNANVFVSDIYTNDESPGWALRIRDKVAALLEKYNQAEAKNPLASFTTDELFAELRRRVTV